MPSQTDLLSSLNLDFAEGLYEKYRGDPDSIPADWRIYFDSLGEIAPAARTVGAGTAPRSGPVSQTQARPSDVHATPSALPLHAAAPAAGNGGAAAKEGGRKLLQYRVDQLIRNYRVRGHIMASIDPLRMARPQPPELDIEHYGFEEEDLDRTFIYEVSRRPMARTLRQIIEHLRRTYCRSIGAQFMHIDDLSVREWLQDRMEGTGNHIILSRREQIRIFTRLTDAVIFEEFIQKKFVGAKSFSLEGGESLIPLLDMAFEKAGEQGMREVVIGMAHRGRLNVLANVIGKKASDIFREFDDKRMPADSGSGSGDVKYHLGYSSDWKTRAGRVIHLSLTFNPSHLEFVNPVALGRMRAKQDRASSMSRGERSMVLLIHGDAAFAGEGVVQESLNLSQLGGYTVGGALHVVVNNQLGFTTTPSEGRSTVYATDVAKMLQSPIFHVNGEDPEAVAQVIRLAMEFRMAFRRDVFIDMYCYRRRGHNESDEPSFTQPILYRAIDQRPSVREGYLEHLLKLEGMTREEADRIAQRRTEVLERELSVARDTQAPAAVVSPPPGIWEGYTGGPITHADDPDTGMDAGELAALLQAQTQLPAGFHLHPKLERFLQARGQMAKGERPIDWSAAEALALAGLLTQGTRVRLSGQDVERGTFSQRHDVLHDTDDGHHYTPLQHLRQGQAPIEIVNSPLSEAGVLGFDYGYSLDYPDALVMWEAQFGDFANAGQVIIDQFIASAEDKWNRLSGLTLLLPHGFEGQGPEHSSGRLERFLSLGAEDNIQVTYPSTPAQYFHLLRRQALRRWRKPLVVMTPKSMLRHPKTVSPLADLAQGRFRRVLPDILAKPQGVTRVLLCTGKIYYDLDQRRQELDCHDLAILRLEELYPFPAEELDQALAPYGENVKLTWVQEEPENMGAWRYLLATSTALGRKSMNGVCRKASASPATGWHGLHKAQQEHIIRQAVGKPA